MLFSKVGLGLAGAWNKICVYLTGTVDVKDLLNGTGAEVGDGALKEVNDLVVNYGRGSVNIIRNVFVYIAVGCLIVGAILLMIHGHNSMKRGEAKAGIGWAIVGGVLGFAAIGIVLFAQSIGTSLFN